MWRHPKWIQRSIHCSRVLVREFDKKVKVYSQREHKLCQQHNWFANLCNEVLVLIFFKPLSEIDSYIHPSLYIYSGLPSQCMAGQIHSVSQYRIIYSLLPRSSSVLSPMEMVYLRLIKVFIVTWNETWEFLSGSMPEWPADNGCHGLYVTSHWGCNTN